MNCLLQSLMMEKFTVLWDCDGLHANSHIPVLRAAKLQVPELDLDYHWMTTYDALYRRVLNLHGEPTASRVRALWFNANVLRQSPPHKLNLLVTRCCRSAGMDNHVVTTRPPELFESTVDWYQQYLPFIVPNIHVRELGSSLTGDQFKVQQRLALCGNFFAEDNGETTQALINSGFDHIGLFDQPWNQSYTDLNHLRCSNSLVLFTRITGQFLRFRSGLDKSV